jgi:hypothetical protein
MLADYLVAEGLIVARLEAQLADIDRLKVLRPADLAGVAETAQHTPAIHVLYGGDVVPGGDAVDEGNYHVIKQRWLAVVAVRSPGSQLTGQQVREAAGPVLTRVIQTLSGWRPTQGLGPLVRVPAPPPAYSKGGFGYFPLQFETKLLTSTSVD